jgi:hypothetical protein
MDTHIGTKEQAMFQPQFQTQDFTQFGTPSCAATPSLPSAAVAGAAWTQTNADPFFAELSPAAMGYRKAPKGFGAGANRRTEPKQRVKASPTLSLHAVGLALHRLGGANRHFIGA